MGYILTGKITDSKLKSITPKDKKITFTVEENLLFIAEPPKNGGKKIRKWFRYDYIRPNGKRNSLSIGTFPKISLAKAREKAREYEKVLNQMDRK